MNQSTVVAKAEATIQKIQRAHSKVLPRCMHSAGPPRNRAMETHSTKYSHVVSNRSYNLTVMRKVCQAAIPPLESVNGAMEPMLIDLGDSVWSWQFRKYYNEQALHSTLLGFLTIPCGCLRVWRLRSRIHIEEVKLDSR